MVKVIMGEIGTGKTKQLIELANNMAREASGDIVFIDNNDHHMYELNHKIRFVDTSQFEITDFCIFYGFLCGILSEDFDISHIYIDGLYDIVKTENNGLEKFLSDIRSISEKFDIVFHITITGNKTKAPEYLQAYL